MKTQITIFLILISQSILLSQNKVDSITINFNEIKIEDLYLSEMNYTPKGVSYDFRVIDSLYFEINSIKTELTPNNIDNQNFELITWDSKRIIFKCENSIPEKCITYNGYSDRAEGHILTRCGEICITILMDAKNGDAVFLPQIFDSVLSPVFTSDYMIVWGAIDDYGKQFYDGIRSYLSVFKILSSDKPLKERFEYIGYLESKNWSIYELYLTDQQETFVMKISETGEKFDYIEIRLH